MSTKSELLEFFFENLDAYVQSRLDHHTMGSRPLGMDRYRIMETIERNVKRTRTNMNTALSTLLDTDRK